MFVALLQTKLQAAGRGGKHSLPMCRRQRRECTWSSPAPRTVEQPQACSISRRSMAAPSQTALQVACRDGKHYPHERLIETSTQIYSFNSQLVCWRQRQARTLSQPRLAPSSSCKLTRSVGASWWLCCRSHCRWLVVAAGTLHTSAGGRDENAPSVRHRLAPSSIIRSVGGLWWLCCKPQKPPAGGGSWWHASTLRTSASCTEEHAP